MVFLHIKANLLFGMAVVLLDLLSRPVAAASLALYEPGPGVDEAFGPFIKGLYEAAEGAESTTATYVSFFTADGVLGSADGSTANGPDDIAAAQQSACDDPCASLLHWPTKTTVINETESNKTFHLNGLAKMTLTNETCGVISYLATYTIEKRGRTVNLRPGDHSLAQLFVDEAIQTDQSCDSF